MKHMAEEEDGDVKKKINSIREELKEKEEELDGLEDLNQALIINERKTNDELQDARKELINVISFFSAFLQVSFFLIVILQEIDMLFQYITLSFSLRNWILGQG